MAKHKKHNNRGKRSKKKRNYKKQILSVLRKSRDKPLNYRQIAAKLGVDNPEARNQIIDNLSQLYGKSKIDKVKRGKYKIAGNPEYYEGELDMTKRGTGYVIVDELEQDIQVPHKKLNKALNGDTVQVFCYGNLRNRNPKGEITQIINRKQTSFVGVLEVKDTFGFVEMADSRMYTDIFIPRRKMNNAKDGMSVLVEIDAWPKKSDSPEGHVVKILGIPGEHETEMQTILAESGLPSTFPEEVEDYADSLDTSIKSKEIQNRRDMRDTLTFTIDPKDAKDFDDALSFKPLDNGNYEIGIHIADVSYYVQPGTILDEEAFERGTSIYLVDRVVPMLPEILSNKACSLRPEEDKYTFSAVFEMDKKGNVVKPWFGRTVTQSNTRFSYDEAQHIIETKKADIPKDIALTGEAYQTSPDIVEALANLNELAEKMRWARMKNGAISFDKVEVKFNLDEDNEPVGIYFKKAKEANKLIEEFMLLANRKVSEFVGKQKPKKTFVYRCHDEPDSEKLASLNDLVSQFGYNLNLKTPKTTAHSLNSLLVDVQGEKEQNLVDTLTIRTMSKAYYSTDNIGHYGLAFDYYSHFTSPIRRYPDIMAHRLLQRYLEQKSSVGEEDYEEMCKHCSDMEIYATEAERDSIKFMQVKFMRQHVGKEFLGVISGVTNFGLFVEIVDNKCEGMIHLRSLQEDRFDYDEDQFAVIGQHTNKRYQLGDEVYVKVKNTDLLKRNLDFELLEHKS